MPKSRTYHTRNRTFLAILLAGAVTALSAIGCFGGDQEREHVVLPTATPGQMPATPTATIVQSEASGALQVGFNLGMQGQPQQGAGVLSQIGRGTKIQINVRPALGAIQQISIREGRCDGIGRWVESIDPAVGGVSETTLTEFHIRDLVDGNHLIALSVPGGTFSEVATCGNIPDLSDLELPDEVPTPAPG